MTEPAQTVGSHVNKAFGHANDAARQAFVDSRKSLDGFSKGVQRAFKEEHVFASAKNFAGRHPLKITAAIVAAAGMGIAQHSRNVHEAREAERGRDR